MRYRGRQPANSVCFRPPQEALAVRLTRARPQRPQARAARLMARSGARPDPAGPPPLLQALARSTPPRPRTAAGRFCRIGRGPRGRPGDCGDQRDRRRRRSGEHDEPSLRRLGRPYECGRRLRRRGRRCDGDERCDWNRRRFSRKRWRLSVLCGWRIRRRSLWRRSNRRRWRRGQRERQRRRTPATFGFGARLPEDPAGRAVSAQMAALAARPRSITL
jgi:hypothetical protein